MFGILNLIYTAGVAATGSIIESNHDNKNRNKALENGDNFYINYKGNEVNTKTGHKQCTYWDEYGDKHVKDIKTRIDTNVSQVERDKAYVEAKRNPNGRTVCQFSDNKDRFRRIKFKDLNNGRVYRDIKIKTDYKAEKKCCCSFYIDDITGDIIRPTDENINKENNMWLFEKVKSFLQEKPEYKKYILGKQTDWTLCTSSKVNGKYYLY